MTNSPPARLSADRNFTLLLSGSTASMFGDQFTLMALPLLVLRLTANAGALGMVLATMALPRALLILLGGAVVDRWSPRRVLLCSRAINALCVVVLAVLTLGGGITLPHIYAIALGIGISTAFAYPAGSAILPQLISAVHLPKANSLAMTARQLSLFVGPMLAALVVGGTVPASTHSAGSNVHGLGVAFAIDAASFLLSLVSLVLIRVPAYAPTIAPARSMLASVAEGIRALWHDTPLRSFTIYSTLVMLLVAGPVQVGLPLLATTCLDLGDASLGILMAANGAGMLAGGLCTSMILRRANDRLGAIIIALDIMLGLAVVLLAFVRSTAWASALLAIAGALGGIGQIGVVTWIQRRVVPEMMGRAMSVIMVLGMSVAPVSAMCAGLLLSVMDLHTLFVATGVVLSLSAALGLAYPPLRNIGADARESLQAA